MAEKSEYAKRYSRYRRRVNSWRRVSRALAGLAQPILLMLIEQDDVCSILAGRVREHPDDEALRRDWLESQRVRTQFLQFIEGTGRAKAKKSSPTVA